MNIRHATTEDTLHIFNLVQLYAERGDVLPRTQVQIDLTINDWLVVQINNTIVGCVSLLKYNQNLAEVRSLIVSDKLQGQGLGAKLLKAIIIEAKKRKIPKLFALTRAQDFFERAGFVLSNREQFPEKIWRDCDQCPVKDNCDEVAVELILIRNSDQNQLNNTFRLHKSREMKETHT